MEMLWQDIHVDKAVTLIHTTVYQLRKTFKENEMENTIQFNNDHYALGVSIDSDYTLLEGLLNAQNMQTSEVEQVLTLYEGDFLKEEDIRWAIPTQQYLRQSVLRYLENIISIVEVNPSLVDSCLLKMLEIDCYNESYMSKLVSLYDRLKGHQKMKEFYKTTEARLRDDLGIQIAFEI